MYKYRITTMFPAEWPNIYKALFGTAQHCASMTNISTAEYSFDTPQTPTDLGPLVRVELISE